MIKVGWFGGLGSHCGKISTTQSYSKREVCSLNKKNEEPLSRKTFKQLIESRGIELVQSWIFHIYVLVPLTRKHSAGYGKRNLDNNPPKKPSTYLKIVFGQMVAQNLCEWTTNVWVNLSSLYTTEPMPSTAQMTRNRRLVSPETCVITKYNWQKLINEMISND